MLLGSSDGNSRRNCKLFHTNLPGCNKIIMLTSLYQEWKISIKYEIKKVFSCRKSYLCIFAIIHFGNSRRIFYQFLVSKQQDVISKQHLYWDQHFFFLWSTRDILVFVETIQRHTFFNNVICNKCFLFKVYFLRELPLDSPWVTLISTNYFFYWKCSFFSISFLSLA